MRVAVIGLGYVGLTFSLVAAQSEVYITGVEVRQEIVDMTNASIPHFHETGIQKALEAACNSGNLEAVGSLDGLEPFDFYVLTVGTPLDSATGEPRLDMLEKALNQVASHMRDGACIILRSTVRVGTTRNLAFPILNQSEKSFFLSMCPERTLEGDAMRELTVLPQIIGGINKASTERSADLFATITGTLVRVSSPESAEMIKLVDNVYRDLQFGFANEVARACDALQISAREVIDSGKIKYSRTSVARPGLVGGPCLEKDPHILLDSLAKIGIDLEITKAGRAVNERQPYEVISNLLPLLSDAVGEPLTVVVAGIAFKGTPETDDLRGSMAVKIVNRLMISPTVKEIRLYDAAVPLTAIQKVAVNGKPFDDIYNACKGAHLLLITNNHNFFRKMDFDRIISELAPEGVIYDFWNVVQPDLASTLGDRYGGTGESYRFGSRFCRAVKVS